MTCTDCPVFKICPEKPVREDYEDENKYLIDLECGVWSCQKTIKKLYKRNEQLKQQIELYKEMLNRNPCVRIPDWHCNDCLEENEQLKQSNWELLEKIEKMKCCENCKHRYYENGINYCNNRCQKNLYNNWELKG